MTDDTKPTDNQDQTPPAFTTADGDTLATADGDTLTPEGDILDAFSTPLEARLCAAGWPPALAKATVDAPFTYAIGLRSGLVITFTSAKNLGHGFVALRGVGFDKVTDGDALMIGSNTYSTERGLEVRVDDIVWALDAPFGS